MLFCIHFAREEIEVFYWGLKELAIDVKSDLYDNHEDCPHLPEIKIIGTTLHALFSERNALLLQVYAQKLICPGMSFSLFL